MSRSASARSRPSLSSASLVGRCPIGGLTASAGPFSRSAVQPFSRSAVPRSTSGRVAGRLVVLHAGRIVEDLPAHALDDAGHPETRRLLDATALTAKWT
jgi:hypothetical protein